MLSGEIVATAIEQAGFGYLIWIPDSHLGTWDQALIEIPSLQIVRTTREGEAIGIAAGLLIGNSKPLVVIQCTGLFEAGDALRNVVHDLQLPLKMIVGVRSWRASRAGQSTDNCPRFTEPIVQTWNIPYRFVDPFTTSGADCQEAIQALADSEHAMILLWGE